MEVGCFSLLPSFRSKASLIPKRSFRASGEGGAESICFMCVASCQAMEGPGAATALFQVSAPLASRRSEGPSMCWERRSRARQDKIKPTVEESGECRRGECVQWRRTDGQTHWHSSHREAFQYSRRRRVWVRLTYAVITQAAVGGSRRTENLAGKTVL